jgi:hypothetical protein
MSLRAVAWASLGRVLINRALGSGAFDVRLCEESHTGRDVRCVIAWLSANSQPRRFLCEASSEYPSRWFCSQAEPRQPLHFPPLLQGYTSYAAPTQATARVSPAVAPLATPAVSTTGPAAQSQFTAKLRRDTGAQRAVERRLRNRPGKQPLLLKARAIVAGTFILAAATEKSICCPLCWKADTR